MQQQHLIEASELADERDPTWIVLDARFELGNPDAGQAAYLEGHIPGARYVHLERDLSSEPVTDHGRHPLPSAQTMLARFMAMGIGADSQVVVYDHRDGSTAARAWWALRYLGHRSVAVLNGGFAAWVAAGYSLEKSAPGAPVSVAAWTPNVQSDWLVKIDDVQSQICLIDSRTAPRYRGEQEPIDPVAGHIPGARNRFFGDNLNSDGRFKTSAELRASLNETLGSAKSDETAFYCGSGVTACHNLLAVAVAGLPPAKLYAGSWSEWCRSGDRPIATAKRQSSYR